MSAAWATILVLALATALIKAAGPALVGGRELPRPLTEVIALFAPALLAALIVVETFATSDGEITIDPRAVGLVAAGAFLSWRESMIGAMLAAAAATALVRLVA